MKKWFVFISFLSILLLFDSSDLSNSMDVCASSSKESLLKENPSTTQQSIEIVSKDLKGCNFLTPRRSVQVVHISSQFRVVQQLSKMLRLFRLKGEEHICKLLQINTYRRTLKLSSLLCRNGYHIYALRKLII